MNNSNAEHERNIIELTNRDIDIRWLKNNLFGEKYKESFSISALLGDISTRIELITNCYNNMPQGEQKDFCEKLYRKQLAHLQTIIFYEKNMEFKLGKLLKKIAALPSIMIVESIEIMPRLRDFISTYLLWNIPSYQNISLQILVCHWKLTLLHQ